MTQYSLPIKPIHTVCASLTLLALLLSVQATQAERYEKAISFSGAAAPSENLSGFTGTSFVVGVPDSSGDDDYAVYGLSSEEQRDHPCYVTVRT